MQLRALVWALAACTAAALQPAPPRARPPTLAIATSLERPAPLARVADAYLELTRAHYLEAAVLQCGVLTSCADVATQCMHGLPLAEVDASHVAAMATVAASLSGGANAVWLRMLEEAHPGPDMGPVARKTAMHWAGPAAFINAHYLMAVPVLTALYGGGGLPADATALADGFSAEGFEHLMLIELGMFVPYNLLAFRVVPPRIRPLTAALLSATFTVLVSALTLGYGDVLGEALESVSAVALPLGLAAS